MLKIYPKNKKLLVSILAIGVISTNAYADRVGDGPVLVKLKDDKVCFSVSTYKPRGYFLKNFKITPQGLDIYNIGVSKFQGGVMWELILNNDKSGSEFNLKPNQCVEYGTLLTNYKSRGSIQQLNTGKFAVYIIGYDPDANKKTTLMSVFSLDVTNGKVTLK